MELLFDETEWAEVQPFHMVLRSVIGDCVRDGLLPAVSASMVFPFPNITTIHGIIVTADSKIVLSQRRSSAAYHPGKWSASFEEQVEPQDLVEGCSGLIVAAARGIAEEFPYPCVEIARDIRLLALALEQSILTPIVIAYVEVGCDSITLQQYHEMASSSGIEPELGPLSFLPFHPGIVAKLLLTGEHPGGEFGRHPTEWHPTSMYRLLLAAMHEWGEDEFCRELGKIVK